MPEGPLGFPRLTSIGPMVEDDGWLPSDNSDVDADLFFHSSERMGELDDESVHLVVTSPPYNIGWEYGEYEDASSDREYSGLLDSVFDECYRVLEEQGRICVVLPDLVREGSEGGTSQLRLLMNTLRSQDNDWRFREIIVWDKKAGRPHKYSTFPRPWGVLLNNVHETILVAQKPGKRRTYERPSEKMKDRSVYSNPPHDVATDVWEIPVQESYVNVGGERVPTFPAEIPRRLIKLYSFKTDTVLDPFTGVGTTMRVALDEGRSAVGYEIRDDLASYISSNLPMKMEFEQED